MAAPYNPPVKNEDFSIRIQLEDMETPGSFKMNPTVEAGDFKVQIDDGEFTNLTTLPSVVPAGSPTPSRTSVKVSLSASEMNGDVITILAVDQTSPKQWADFCLSIPTTSA